MVKEWAREAERYSIEERVIAWLRQEGRLQVETVIDRLGCGWAQGIFAIDRLSRSGALRLGRAGCHYELWVDGGEGAS